MRGEYRDAISSIACLRELPPHARRIRHKLSPFLPNPGTTSACAENTASIFSGKCPPGNYLRMRGEYPKLIRPQRQPRGTTSACAENTVTHRGTAQAFGNYLRMRGEYCAPTEAAGFSSELPPHARRIHRKPHHTTTNIGTTSACAENTHTGRSGRFQYGNYLRMRGEYAGFPPHASRIVELPPHARRILSIEEIHFPILGTTSACAENTPVTPVISPRGRNYLRMRGEYEVEQVACY